MSGDIFLCVARLDMVCDCGEPFQFDWIVRFIKKMLELRSGIDSLSCPCRQQNANLARDRLCSLQNVEATSVQSMPNRNDSVGRCSQGLTLASQCSDAVIARAVANCTQCGEVV